MTKLGLLVVLFAGQCVATESLDSVPVNYTEIRLRTIFCDATFAATVTDKEIIEAARWAAHYGVVCQAVKDREAKIEAAKPKKH